MRRPTASCPGNSVSASARLMTTTGSPPAVSRACERPALQHRRSRSASKIARSRGNEESPRIRQASARGLRRRTACLAAASPVGDLLPPPPTSTPGSVDSQSISNADTRARAGVVRQLEQLNVEREQALRHESEVARGQGGEAPNQETRADHHHDREPDFGNARCADAGGACGRRLRCPARLPSAPPRVLAPAAAGARPKSRLVNSVAPIAVQMTDR